MSIIQGGALIRHARQPNRGGTLGCVVVSLDDPARRYLLTAAHVIGLGGYARRGDAIEAKLPDLPGWAKVAEFEAAVKMRDAAGVLRVCDAAIARITDDTAVSDEIAGLGAPTGAATGVFEGMRLRLCGAASGLVSDARVQSTERQVPMTYRDFASGGTYTLNFARQLLYGRRQGEVWASATQGVDSGALVLDQDGLAVGLHIGHTPDDYGVAASICTPIRAVLDALRVALPAEVRAVPAAPAPAVAAAPGAAPAAPAAPVLHGADLVSQRSFDQLGVSLRSLMEPHNPFGGVRWQLASRGLIVDGRLERSPGVLVTVPRVWRDFGPLIEAAARKHGVPVELIMATICTETSGRANALRLEPGYISDEETPHRVSPGLMQTLISTARSATQRPRLSRQDLFDPATSIDAGTAYIGQQRTTTRLDPPQVACAYNAGSLILNRGEANRWKMRQFPIGTGAHADRFTLWFNDCFAHFAENPSVLAADAPSYFLLLAGT